MTYAFLTDTDIHTLIREEFKNGLITNPSNNTTNYFIKRAEAAAITQIKNKLRDRYNVDAIFTLPDEFRPTQIYQIGARVRQGDLFFRCILADTPIEAYPTNTPDYWLQEDPRDNYLVNICTDITLYHLHARNSPRAISELRSERYQDAIAWLDSVKDGQENPDLPLLAPDDIPNVTYGFDREPTDHYY